MRRQQSESRVSLRARETKLFKCLGISESSDAPEGHGGDRTPRRGQARVSSHRAGTARPACRTAAETENGGWPRAEEQPRDFFWLQVNDFTPET